MNRAAVPVVLAFVLVGTRTRSLDAPQNDPFSFFAPTIQISADDRKHLAAGDAIAKILPARDHELAILAEGSTTATAEMLVNSARPIATLNKSPFVPRGGPFSKQPGLRDVAMLTLDRIDLDALKTCRPGACDPKLTTPGALALTLLAASESSSMHYLVYVNRTWVDPVHALWRPIVEHRVKSEAAKVFAQARERIEGGNSTHSR